MNKNLKRVFSGAMASSMLVGMMATGASAAVADQFSDAEKIVNTNAVDTLVALNIINGKDDGTFDPTAVVTRASMAKMLTIALNGGKEPVLPTNATPTFSDIKGHWAESYIEYCTSLGIIAGRGDGTFDPDATVTGSEAAKMMLVAMGYPADIYGLTGSAWAINVGVEANKAKLYDGIESIDASAGLSRDNTAQLIYNGVLGNTMNKTPQQVVGGDTTWVYNTTGDSIFASKYNGKIFIGTMKGNGYTISSLKKEQIQVEGRLDTESEKDSNGSSNDRVSNFTADFDISNIGEEVKVLFKDGNGGNTNTPDDKDTIYGVFNTGKTDVLYTTVFDIDDDYDSTKTDKVKIDGTVYTVAPAATAGGVYTNYVDTNGSTVPLNKANIQNLFARKGDVVKFVKDSDGKLKDAYLTETKMTYVTAVTDEKVTLSGIGTLKFEEHAIVEGLEKNDVVVYNKLYETKVDDAFFIVEKAEVVSGTLEKYTGNKNDDYKDNTNKRTITIDGETYKVYNNATMITGFNTSDAKSDVTNLELGETYDLYLVNGFVGAAVQTSEGANNYSVIIDVDSGTTVGSALSGVRIQVLTADGTKVVLTPNSDSKTANGSATTTADYKIGSIVTWTGDEDDATVTIEKSYVAGTSATYNSKTNTVGTAKVTSNTVLYVNVNPAGQSAKYKVYNLNDLRSQSLNDAIVLTNDDNEALAVFADNHAKPSGASENTVYGVVSSRNGQVKIDGDQYTSYTVENDTDTWTLYVGKNNTNIAKGELVSFEPTADDIYGDNDITMIKNDASVTKTNLAVSDFDGEVLTGYTYTTWNDTEKVYKKVTGNSKSFYVDDETIFVYVNMDDLEAGEDIGISDFNPNTGYMNVKVLSENTKDSNNNISYDYAKVIFVETSGDACFGTNCNHKVANSDHKD